MHTFYLPPAASLPDDAEIVWNGSIEHSTVVAAQRVPETASRPEPLPPQTRSLSLPASHKAHYRSLLTQMAIGDTFTTRTLAAESGIPLKLVTLYSSQCVAIGWLEVTGWELREEGGGMLRRYRVTSHNPRPRVVTPRRRKAER